MGADRLQDGTPTSRVQQRKDVPVFAVSPAAAAFIEKGFHGVELPAGAGLRLRRGGQTEHGVAIEISFVTEPTPADHVVDIDTPAAVYLEPAAATVLDGYVLDAESDGDGRARFSIRPQGTDAGYPVDPLRRGRS